MNTATAIIAEAKRLFAQSGMTLEELAQRMGIESKTARQSVWLMFNKTPDMRLSTVEKLAQALGVTVRDLLRPTPQVKSDSRVPHRSPFRYPGGKSWFVPHLRRWLANLPAQPSVFIEPFAGGASASLAVVFESLVPRAVLSDIDPNIAAVWRVLFNRQAPDLVARILDFNLTLDAVRLAFSSPTKKLLDKAFVAILRNRVQRGGIMSDGASLINKGENGKGIASRWYPETLAKRIRAIHCKRRMMTFCTKDGLELIKEYANQKSAAFFIDPPYPIAGKRLYSHSKIEHEKLFKIVAKAKGEFLMTYEASDYVLQLAKAHGFQTRAVAMRNTHNAVMNEVIIGKNLLWFDG